MSVQERRGLLPVPPFHITRIQKCATHLLQLHAQSAPLSPLHSLIPTGPCRLHVRIYSSLQLTVQNVNQDVLFSRLSQDFTSTYELSLRTIGTKRQVK